MHQNWKGFRWSRAQRFPFLSLFAFALLGMLLLFPTISLAANWYVDNAATGLNNGTSWATAWSNFNRIVWGSNGVKAGDTLYISGGSTSKTYTATAHGMLAIGAIGTLGSTITLTTGAKSPSPSGHDGLVNFDGNGTYGNFITGNYAQYIIVDGEKNGAINWVFQNGPTHQGGAGLIDLPNNKGTVVRYLELKGASQGINFTGFNPSCIANELVEVHHLYIHDIRDDFAIRAIGGCASNPGYDGIFVHDNTIYLNRISMSDGSGPDGVTATYGLTMYNNKIKGVVGTIAYAAGGGQHSDHVQPMGKYFKIYNNLFYNPGSACIELEGGDSSSGYARIWNNVCASVDPGQTGYHRGIELQWNSNVTAVTDVLIYSNTFVDLNNYYAIAGGPPASATISGMEIKNNIFYNSGKSGAYEIIRLSSANYTCGTDLVIDHNLINAGAGGGTTVTCRGVQYSPTNTQTGAPSFVSYAPKTSANDFRLAAGDTAARGKGVNLSAYFVTDILGALRPQGAGWALGAYEATGNVIGTPVNLRVVAQ